MNKTDIEKLARRSGQTPREFCVSEIERWRERLQLVSDDYRDLTDEEFERRLDREIQRREEE